MSEFSKLSEVADVIDSLHKTPKYADVGRPMVRCTDVKYGRLDLSKTFKVDDEVFAEFSRRYTPKHEDIIITRVGSYGITAIVDDTDFCLGQNTSVIVPKINPRYLYLALNSPYVKNQIEFSVVGSTQKTLSLKAINNLDIPRFDSDIEDKIAEIIGDLDDKIELNRQTNQTLEQIAQAIFKSWFVDFEPVKAKIAAKQNGQNPELAAMCAISGKTEEQLKDLIKEADAHGSANVAGGTTLRATLQQLKTTAALFPDALVESELGEIPEGWDVVSINEHIDILNGFAFKSKDYSGQGTFVLRTKNFNADRIVKRLNDDVFLPVEFLTSHKKFICEPYDYHLIMVGASIGNRGLIYPQLLPALRNQNMWCFRSKSDSYIKQVFVKHVLDSIVERSMGLASGSAREFFRKGDFGNQKICSGSISIQKAFSDLVLPIMEQQSNLDSEQDNISEIRDALLPKLLSGELEINNAA
tara:strand:- start:136893 stop:138302 length:1410 start_codon:yes stop_codon:yes gene_type:complete